MNSSGSGDVDSLRVNESDKGGNTSVDAANSDDEYKRYIYVRVVPFILIICTLSLALNLCILCSWRWMQRTTTPTLRFIFSLALADAFVSFVQIFHYTVQSLLPTIYGIDLGRARLCVALVVEALRLSFLVVSALHLLALATNHYFGIVRPLHYAATVTRRTTLSCLVCIWTAPIAFLFIYFSSLPGMGFRAPYCRKYSFVIEKRFVFTYSSLYVAPFLVMSFIYGHIFLVVRRHQRGLIRVEENGNQEETTTSQQQRRKSSTIKDYLRRSTRRWTEDHSRQERRCSTVTQMRKSVKAVVTTLLILGSYLLGWIPAVFSYCLTCNDCLYPAKRIPTKVSLGIFVTVNILVIAKSLLNPIIYAVRIPEIREALYFMRRSLRCGSRGVWPRNRQGTMDTTISTRSTSIDRRFVPHSRTSRSKFQMTNIKRKWKTESGSRRFDGPETTTNVNGT